MPSHQYRNFCWTSYEDVFYDNPNVTYFICQEEKCPKTGRYHLQGYCELDKRWTLSKIKEEFGNRALHIEMRRGSQQQAIDYCKKEDTATGRRWEFGTPKSQGDRNDLKDVYEMVKKGMRNIEILESVPHTFMRYGRAIDNVRNVLNKESGKRMRKVEVYVLWGESGTGKTRYVYDNEDINDIYKLDKCNGDNIWFDGYEGEKILLIDEFYGSSIKFSMLLQLLDIYPMKLQVKGGHTWANWERVYITSNKPYTNWYRLSDSDISHKCKLQPLARRITESIMFGKEWSAENVASEDEDEDD